MITVSCPRRHAALPDDGHDRAQQVLVRAHAAGDAVHDDADGLRGHRGLPAALRPRARGQRRRLHARPRQRAVQLLAPVRHVAAGA